jgi:hypothetical protein
VRILLLGSSNDAGQWFKEGRKRHEIAADMLAAELGEPVDVIVKGIWPTAGLLAKVEGWIAEYEPDLIYLSAVAYWFLYPSVPLRVKRLLGRFGPGVAGAGFRVAESPRWGHNAVFRGTRRLLQKTIGGDTNFTPDEVIERFGECIRVAARAEGVILVVSGPQSRADHSTSKRSRARNEIKRRYVDSSLEDICRQAHITYEGSESWTFERPEYQGNRVGDGLHGNAKHHERVAEILYRSWRHGLEDAGRLPRTQAALTAGVPGGA